MSDFENNNNLHAMTVCPFCGSNNIKIVIEKEKEDYDLFSGIIGTICLGPIGLLCGLCFADGEKKRTTCICNNCGKRFLDD